MSSDDSARIAGEGVVRERIRADGRELDTIRYVGDDARPAIVLLHEGLGSIALWRDVPQRLRAATGRTIVAYSRWGYGDSEPLRKARAIEYMHREGEIVLPELLAQMGLRRPVLVGHSDGASIAIIAAGAHPSLCSALILEAPHVFVEELSVRSIEQARIAWQTTELPEKLARYHADAAGAFRGWNDVWLDPRFRSWNIEAYAETIACPVLLIQGEDDEYGTREQLARILRRVPSAHTLMLAGVGHSPHRDATDLVMDRIATFVAQVTG